MKQHNVIWAILAALAIAVIGVFGGGAFMAPANAAPPTVTPSPGYDARLQEQRQRAAPTVYAPVVPAPKRVSRPHVKRSHDGAH
jgi:hypothetical protein